MGYNTRYRLDVVTPESSELDKNSIIQDLVSDDEFEAKYALEEDGSSSGGCKWYDHEEEMRTFSMKYPTVVFLLEGDGEESGDVWRKYFMNGKCQIAQAKLVFDQFDLRKLK
jgi:hypothetical protein